jgi:hypothetical protein
MPFYPFFATFTLKDAAGDYHYLSEDWAFCERARQIGFKVWMDQSIILQHMGWYPFTVADLAQETSPFPSTGTDLVEVEGSPQVHDEPLLASLVDDIAEWAGEDPGDVRRMLPLGQAKLAELWATRNESEDAWYRREDVGLAYISDLAYWHLNGGCPLKLAERLAGKRVLDYGAGIGTFALKAALSGAEVATLEVNPVLRDFIHWRFAKYGAQLHEGGDWPYDAIVAWHVFEHLPDAEVGLSRVIYRLAPGGTLITQSDFEQHDSHPMHHVRSDWADVLARQGFRSVEPDVYSFEPVRELVTV